MDKNVHTIGSSSAVISQLENAEEHKTLNGGNLASHNNPFSDDVAVEPLNRSSQNMGYFPFDETRPLATENEDRSLATSSSPFKDDVFDVHLGKFSHNMAEIRDPLATDKDRGDLASDNLATSTSSFSEGVNDVPLNKVSNGIGSLTSDNLATSSSPFSDSVDDPLNSSYTETDNLTTTKDSVPLTLISPSSNVVDVRPSNNTPQRIMGLSFDENGQMPFVEEQKPLTTQNADPQTSPFSSSPDSPFKDPFQREIHDQIRTLDAQESSKNPNSSSTSLDNDNLDAPLKYTETNHLSTTKDSMPLSPISPSSNGVDVRPMNDTPQRIMGLSFDENGQMPLVEEHNSLTTQNTKTQTSPFSSSPDSPFKDPFRREIHDQTQTPGAQECSTSPKSSSTLPYSDNLGAPLKNTETNHFSTTKNSMPLSPISPSSNGVDVRPTNNTPQRIMGLSFDENCQMPLTPQNTDTQSTPFRSSPNTPFSSSKPSNLPVRDQSPPVQVMERPTMPKYRIPSHVFARDKSNAHGDWSVASNESLFSIQMGNSFTTDQFALRSGEFNYSSKPCTPIKAASGGYNSPDFGLKESDLKTINEVSKSGEIQFHEKPRISQESTMSTKSFQFPILADVDKCNSISMTGLAATGTTQQQTQSHTLTAPKPMEAEAQRPEEPNAPPPPEEPPKATTSWFTCFSCCSCLPARR